MTYEPFKTTPIQTYITYSYASAERAYREGYIDQTDWDIYRFVWRNSMGRFSDLAQEFEIKG